ncbi:MULTISPECIES: DNA repair protein RecN [Caproicibacterium]|uniref:DNA repair protein RecN n=1 Tax=Caproicibacterium argilliputei TaxID=3030016 RepID=A0AA97D8V9_9FIRM|nr:DNA repair protein RecN [Caproicibacterium argilliputei]WOC31439.1 DNA repair protein RecN [Caproicibacterium argilliputei]
MLNQLYIENIAVIEKATIDFGAGFNVLTGETGAGKSIIIDAIHAVLGQRTSRELVRSGAKGAFVSASFSDFGQRVQRKLEALGFSPEEDGTLLLQREIREDGRTVCHIGARPASVSALKELGALLINLHGQHESYGLLSPENHLRYLDRMGVSPELRHSYREAYTAWKGLCRQLSTVNLDESEKARRIDLLTYQAEELEAAQIQPGEQQELQNRRQRIRNSGKITEALRQADTLLNGGEELPGACAAVLDAAKALSSVGDVLPELGALTGRLESIGYDLQDCAEEIGGQCEDNEFDPRELDDIEERLNVYYHLSLKYGKTEEEMLQYLENCRRELDAVQHSGEELERLQKACAKAEKEVRQLGAQLSSARRKAATGFARQVRAELAYLDMPGVVFTVQQEPGEPGPAGCDAVQFLISANPGEPARPLAKIASGGELSRILLAIQSLLSGRDSVGTLIFDEVDTGVSGSAAQKIGQKLRQTAKGRQVLCVTHLAQIAALGDRQYRIEKHTESGRTFTQVTLLDHAGRRQELARLIGGTQITPLTLQNAEEMLQLAVGKNSKNETE